MPAIYTTLSEQVEEALEHLSRRPPQDHPDRQVWDRLWRAARILQAVLRGLQRPSSLVVFGEILMASVCVPAGIGVLISLVRDL
jgi:hypothetical protein